MRGRWKPISGVFLVFPFLSRAFRGLLKNPWRAANGDGQAPRATIQVCDGFKKRRLPVGSAEVAGPGGHAPLVAAQITDVRVPGGAVDPQSAGRRRPWQFGHTGGAKRCLLGSLPIRKQRFRYHSRRGSQVAEGKRMFVRRRSGAVTFARCNAKRLRVSLLASVFAMGVLAPSTSEAACTDTFSDFLVTAGTPPGFTGGFSYQSMFPLGIGASINAAVATMNTVNTAFLSPSSSFVSARGDPQPGQMGGGVWARATAGSSDTRASTTGTIQGVGGIGYL